MHLFRKAFLLFLALGLACTGSAGKTTAPAVEVSALKADYEINPLGIDRIPQFSWEISGNYDGVRQSAYRILIATSPELLAEGDADVYDSGKVASSASTAVSFSEIPFQSRTRYYWKVKIWDGAGVESPWSETAYYETALLHSSDWLSGWIGYVPGMPGRVLYFKGTQASDKEVAKARAYIAGLGFYELNINGKKVGDCVLDPAQSTYSKRVYYRTYDITDNLVKGANSFVVPVAPGWLGTPRLRIQVEITYADGSQETMTSDRFRSVITGPLMYSTVFDGEIYDARLENPDIYKPGVPPGLMNKQWAWAHNTDDPVGKMVAQRVEPIRIVEEIVPKLVAEPAEGKPFRFRELITMSFATSIDALIVGVTFSAVGANIWISAAVIGAVTFALSLFGVFLGSKIGSKLGGFSEIAGGAILLLLGLKILLEHLGVISF